MTRLHLAALCGAIVFVFMLCAPGQAEGFAPPTDAEIDGLLADPASLSAMLEGATGPQAADVLLAAIEKIDGLELTADEKKQAIATLVALAVNTPGLDVTAMMASLAKKVSTVWLPTVVAAAVLVSDNAQAIIDAVVQALGRDTDAAAAALAAAREPEIVLGVPLKQFLLSMFPTAGRTGSAVPLPPIAPKYEGQ